MKAVFGSETGKHKRMWMFFFGGNVAAALWVPSPNLSKIHLVNSPAPTCMVPNLASSPHQHVCCSCLPQHALFFSLIDYITFPFSWFLSSNFKGKHWIRDVQAGRYRPHINKVSSTFAEVVVHTLTTMKQICEWWGVSALIFFIYVVHFCYWVSSVPVQLWIKFTNKTHTCQFLSVVAMSSAVRHTVEWLNENVTMIG